MPDDALSWSYWMVDEHKAGTSGARLVFHEEGKIGVVAALAAARRCDPREVPLEDIRQRLGAIGHIVPVKE